MKIVIVGGVAAGASAATRLRRLNEEAEIIILDKGPAIGFSSCAMPYRLSATIENTSDLTIISSERMAAEFKLDIRCNSTVTSVLSNEHQVVVSCDRGTYNLDYDKLVLAPGSIAKPLEVPGLELLPHFNLKTVTDLTKIVKHLEAGISSHITIVGGSYIGIETAENLQMAGYKVTIIEASNQLLGQFDRELALYADAKLISSGIEVIKNKCVAEFEVDGVILCDGTKLKTDAVIVAIGVEPDTDFLSDCDVELDAQGFIAVNDNYQTSDRDIYAGGDAILVTNAITGDLISLPLAGAANKQGRLIADHVSGLKITNNGYIGSSVIKLFDLTLASTGLNEKQIINKQIDYNYVYAAPFDRVSIMPDANVIIFKLLFERTTGQILGAQAISSGVCDKRIDVIATAIKAAMTVFDLADLELVYAPSFGTGKDAVNKVGYIASNLVAEAFKQVKFTEVYNLVRTNAQIIDIRSEADFKQLHVDGAINIPMGEVRQRLDEIDKDKPVFVYCNSGQRSYNTALMLKANGYDVYNIAGSFLFIKNYELALQFEDDTRANILR